MFKDGLLNVLRGGNLFLTKSEAEISAGGGTYERSQVTVVGNCRVAFFTYFSISSSVSILLLYLKLLGREHERVCFDDSFGTILMNVFFICTQQSTFVHTAVNFELKSDIIHANVAQHCRALMRFVSFYGFLKLSSAKSGNLEPKWLRMLNASTRQALAVDANASTGYGDKDFIHVINKHLSIQFFFDNKFIINLIQEYTN